MSERGTCKSCGAAILWAETESGRMIPLDYEPESRYVLSAATTPMKAVRRNTFTCHLNTCKYPDRWKKPKA